MWDNVILTTDFNVISAIGLVLAEYSMTSDLSHYVKCYLIPIYAYQNLSCGYWQRKTLLMSAEIYFSTRCGILRGHCLYFLYQVLDLIRPIPLTGCSKEVITIN